MHYMLITTLSLSLSLSIRVSKPITITNADHIAMATIMRVHESCVHVWHVWHVRFAAHTHVRMNTCVIFVCLLLLLLSVLILGVFLRGAICACGSLLENQSIYFMLLCLYVVDE